MLAIAVPGSGAPQRATMTLGTIVGLHLGLQVWRLQRGQLAQNAFFLRLATLWLGSIVGVGVLRVAFGAALFSGSAMAGMAGGYVLAVIGAKVGGHTGSP